MMARLKHSYTTQQHQEASLFEESPETPAVGSEESPPGIEIIQPELDRWEAIRDAGIPPLFQSELSDSESARTDFLVGAYMLGLIGRGKVLTPQQYRCADVINSGNESVAILMARRSTKTTAAFCIALGRCRRRGDYMVAFTTCTTAKKAGERFYKDIVVPLERVYRDPDNRPFQIMRGKGAESIRFPNGSVFQLVAPEGDAFRSDAYDLIILDEAGAAGVEMSDDLKQGVLATMDTRDGAQLVVAGTAAKFREGNLLWEYLVDGRTGANDTGILEYAAPDSTTDEELAAWEPDDDHPGAHAKELVLAAHPGIGTLTTIEKIHSRYNKLSHAAFAEEYLSVFGTVGTTSGIFDIEKWAKAGNDGKLPSPPQRFAMAIAVHPDQQTACIVAVWRVRRKARILVLEHRSGVDWLPKRAKELAVKYKTGIIHDTNGAVTVEVETLARMRPKPKLLPQNFANVKTAAALIVKEVDGERVEHYNQDELTSAIRLAKKRSVGPTAWALGRRNPEDDIICAEAAALALRVYDETASRRSIMPSEAA
jgi:hypothetical protein